MTLNNLYYTLESETTHTITFVNDLYSVIVIDIGINIYKYNKTSKMTLKLTYDEFIAISNELKKRGKI